MAQALAEWYSPRGGEQCRGSSWALHDASRSQSLGPKPADTHCCANVRFHELRKHHPKVASKRKVNETLYASMGVRTGWFCGAAPLRDSIATVKVRPPLRGSLSFPAVTPVQPTPS